MPASFEGDTKTNLARLSALDNDTTYYWRVRATKPVLSHWSDVSSFTTTGLSAAVVAPELLSPKAGAEGVSLKPLLQWGAITGSSGYELMVATDFSFDSPVIAKTGDYALPATAWQSNINLDYQTTYCWKVRAAGAGSLSDWSAVGAFITIFPPPTPSPTPAAVVAPSVSASASASTQPSSPIVQSSSPPSGQTQPEPATQSGLPGWFPYMAGAMMMAIAILLAVVVVLLVIIKRR